VRGGVARGQGVSQHVGAVGDHPDAGGTLFRGLGEHVVHQIADRLRHVRRQGGHRLVLVRERDG
jgi:altronate dehydratase